MTDEEAMGQALAQARQALGNTAPNPPVGAVLLKGGVVIGEGFTQPAGLSHAEPMALADARAKGHDPRGATLVVTLEPCCHHGRTAPCTDAILAAGVSRVVVGVLDPFPAMRGRSVALLRDAGVDVALGVAEDACAARILGFARALTAGLPEVTLKAGVSADGRLATASGESKWITSEAARERAHALRSEHDAVLVGIGTVLADDPRLTTRVAGGRDAVPVVLDTHLRIPSEAALFAGSRRPVVVCGEGAPERALPAEIVRVPVADGRVDAEGALRALARRGLHRVLVEGGAEVHRALLSAGLVDTVELFVAPLLLPGGRSFVGGDAVERLADGVAMRWVSAEPVGADLHLVARLRHGVAADPFGALRAGVAPRG